MMMKKSIISWSGGKDCTMALHQYFKETGKNPEGLLTAYNTSFKRVTMHGTPISLIEDQAKSLGIPLFTLGLPENVTDELYEELFLKKLKELKKRGFSKVIFGDIFLEDLRNYRINQLNKVGMAYAFPNWKRNTSELISEFIDLGYKALIVAINETLLPKSFAGLIIDETFPKELPSSIDSCGENGEFHTFVYDGLLFKSPIPFKKGKTISQTYPSSVDDGSVVYRFTDLIHK